MTYTDFREIPVWQLSHEKTLTVYKMTKEFPHDELFGLTSQLRRSSASISANIVEGIYRETTKELIHFLYIARGSTGETLSHLTLAKDLGYITESDYNVLFESFDSVAKQINAWINSLKRKGESAIRN